MILRGIAGLEDINHITGRTYLCVDIKFLEEK
jgi:hypothetical protein